MSTQQQQHLAFEPITVRGVVLSNRIVMAPMTRRSAPGGIVGEPNATYYAKRAAGGVGLIITEGVQVNNTDAVDQPNTPQCITDEQIAGWKSVVDACKAATNGSSKLCMQIWHTGLYSLDPIGPTGGIDVSNEQRKVPLGKEATPADIERIMDEMALCASNAVHRCGFDAVQIHGAHGYFIDSFSSPVLNQRDDAFGGDAHRRAMLAAAVTRKVRAAIGDKALLLFRFSQWIVTDYQHQKFPSSTELRVFLEAIVQAGVDVVDMSTRRMLDVAYPSEHSTRTFAGWVKHIISEMGSSVKVIAVGSATVGRMFGEGAMSDAFELRDPTPVLSLIDEGEADLLGVGRALISDADWVNKVRTGQWESLVPYSADALKVLQ